MIVRGCVVFRKKLSDKVYAATEPDRHLKEVEFVAKQQQEWIKNYLAKVQEKRGFESYKKLREDVLRLWKK